MSKSDKFRWNFWGWCNFPWLLIVMKLPLYHRYLGYQTWADVVNSEIIFNKKWKNKLDDSAKTCQAKTKISNKNKNALKYFQSLFAWFYLWFKLLAESLSLSLSHTHTHTHTHTLSFLFGLLFGGKFKINLLFQFYQWQFQLKIGHNDKL